MKNIKKYIALLTCLFMFACPMTAFADDEIGNITETTTQAATEQQEKQELPEEELQEEALSLYEQLISAKTVADLYSIMESADKEEQNALTKDEINAIFNHIDKLDPEGVETEGLVDILINLDNFVPGAEEDGEEDQVFAGTDEFESGYIYFDLYYGDVKFTSGEYTGYIYSGTAGKSVKVTGQHKETNKYYIFQSKGQAYDTGIGKDIPQYARIMGGQWGEFITNNTDVLGVIDSWDKEAAAVGREKTPATIKTNYNTVKGNPNVEVPQHHRIIIDGAAGVITNYDITIDDVWSGFQNDDCKDANGKIYEGDYIKDGSHYRTSGGLSFRPMNKETTANIRLKGDNRFGNVHYDVESGAGGDSKDQSEAKIDNRIEQMFFHNADSASNPGTMTVGNLGGDTGYNHFCSVIGGANNPNYVPGLVFEGGTIFAGATERDNCTAIGGGGCGFGGVTIRGGTITAVTATNGTAIGGGIGDGSNGGAADVSIEGGNIYAYNHGLAIEGTRESGGAADTVSGQVVRVVMPAVAIGSGSSRRDFTVPARISITNGTVYAQSTGGTVIGGGSSNNFDAANAYVNISGGTVTAKSVAGDVRLIHEYDRGAFPEYVTSSGSVGSRETAHKETVSASTSIGGGTAGVPFRYNGTSGKLYNQGTGGNAILNISGNARIYAGSIGGGGVSELPDPNSGAQYANLYATVEPGKIGSAQVTISGGTTQGQVIMAKGAKLDCFLEMTGGTIDNSTKDDTFVFLKDNGGAAYVENGNATISGGKIINCDDAIDGGVFYVIGGNVIMSGGTIGGKDSEGNSVGNSAKRGGVAFVKNGNVEMSGGSILNNEADYGGAIYADGGNVTVHHGEINENSAINGGAIYTNGGNFIMESGTLRDNLAIEIHAGAAEAGNEGYGGAVYANDGDITIGILGCKQNSPCATHDKNPVGEKTHHPIVTGNEAVFGGGFAINNGEVTLYCCNVTDNESNNEGTGMNVFMSGASGVIKHHYEGAVIGDDEDHGMVSTGGALEVIQASGEVLKVRIKYHSNYGFDYIWEGVAPDNYYLNLPYCPSNWSEEQKPLTFVGWAETPVGTQASEIRDKDDYKSIGTPIKIIDTVPGEAREMHFYAVWAPQTSSINYALCIDSDNVIMYNDLSNADKDIFKDYAKQYDFRIVGYNIPGFFTEDENGEERPIYPEKAGYKFIGWKMYADMDAISNWGADALEYPVNKLVKLNPVIDGNDKHRWNGKANQNFGNITLIAVFEPAYSELTINKAGAEGTNFTLDSNQKFLFRIQGTPYDDALGNVDLYVLADGNGSAKIGELPVGEYIVTEEADWSWRYEAKKLENGEYMPAPTSKNVTVDDPGQKYEVTFINSRDEAKWLSGDAYESNNYESLLQTVRNLFN